VEGYLGVIKWSRLEERSWLVGYSYDSDTVTIVTIVTAREVHAEEFTD
jgi:hypothetical protein